MKKLIEEFYARDSLAVAHGCVGKLIAHRLPDGSIIRLRISEAEAYRGEADTACHASRGKTPRSASSGSITAIAPPIAIRLQVLTLAHTRLYSFAP